MSISYSVCFYYLKDFPLCKGIVADFVPSAYVPRFTLPTFRALPCLRSALYLVYVPRFMRGIQLR